jgi:hypothetical protein
MSRRDRTGSRQFHSRTGIPFGWWSNALALQRDMDREVNGGGNFRTTLSNQSVNLELFSKMNASLAKQPFTAKTLSAILGHCSSVLGACKKKRLADLKATTKYKSANSGEHLKMELMTFDRFNPPLDMLSIVASNLEYLKFAVSVHRIYIQRFMNKRWKLTLENIDREEEQLKDCLRFFEQWRLDTAEYKNDDSTISRQHQERFFLFNTDLPKHEVFHLWFC